MSLGYGILAAFITATVFALNSIVLRRGVLTGYVYSGTLISILTGLPIYMLSSVLAGEFIHLDNVPISFILIFITVGILHFGLGRYLYYLSVHYSGTIISMPIMASGQIIAAYLAILLLNERVTIFKILGLLFATVGFVLFFDVGRTVKTVKKSLLLSSIVALIFASTTLVIRQGLLISRLPITGVLISYLAISPVYLLLLYRKSLRIELINISKSSMRYLIISAILVNVGQLFKYVSLNIAEVSIVGPIVSTEIVLNLIFSAFINRRYEMINYKTILASLSVFLGIIIILY